METFSELLTAHVIRLQQVRGRLINQKQLAAMLAVGETSLNLAWNGKRPPSKNLVEKCAVFFLDMKFYDVSGFQRPNEKLNYVERNWEKLPGETQTRIAEEVGYYTTEPVPTDDGAKATKS
jgi:hypothetical protein